MLSIHPITNHHRTLNVRCEHVCLLESHFLKFWNQTLEKLV